MHLLYVVVCMTSRPAKPVAAAPSPLSALDRQPAATKQTAYPTEICSGWTTGPEDPAGVLLPCPAGCCHCCCHSLMRNSSEIRFTSASLLNVPVRLHLPPWQVLAKKLQHSAGSSLTSMSAWVQAGSAMCQTFPCYAPASIGLLVKW